MYSTYDDSNKVKRYAWEGGGGWGQLSGEKAGGKSPVGGGITGGGKSPGGGREITGGKSPRLVKGIYLKKYNYISRFKLFANTPFPVSVCAKYLESKWRFRVIGQLVALSNWFKVHDNNFLN